MAVGMVEIFQKRLTHAFEIATPLLVAAIISLPAHAQSQTEVKLAPLSKECQAPNLSTPTRPLPNTLRALRERKILKLLTIGASASAGVETQAGGYQSIIETTLEKAVPGLDVRIIDRGVSGELVRDAAERMKTQVALEEPDLVLWQVGSSDAIARIPVDEFSDSLREGIRWLKERNVDVVIVGPHYIRQMRRDANYQAIRNAVSRVTDEEKVLRVARYEAMEMMEHMQQGASPPNEFVLTEEGYSCMAEYVVRAITAGILIKR